MPKDRQLCSVLPEKPAHLLLFSPNWLGDVVMALPAFQQWRTENPNVSVTVLAKPGVAPLWRWVDGADDIVTLAPGAAGMRDAVRTLRGRACDAAILLPHTFRTGWLAWRAGVPSRRGTVGQFRRLLITDPVYLGDFDNRHQQFEIFNLFGLVPPDPPPAPRLTIPQEALRDAAVQADLQPERNHIAILPGAARGDSKRWPAGHFAAAALQISRVRADVHFLICGTTAEATPCALVASALGGRATNLAGKTRLPTLAAILAQCAAVCCNDSGGMHLATAAGTPVVAVFGLTDPAKTGPLGPAARVIAPEGVKVSRAIPRRSPAAVRALASVPPESVAAALLEILAP